MLLLCLGRTKLFPLEASIVFEVALFWMLGFLGIPVGFTGLRKVCLVTQRIFRDCCLEFLLDNCAKWQFLLLFLLNRANSEDLLFLWRLFVFVLRHAVSDCWLAVTDCDVVSQLVAAEEDVHSVVWAHVDRQSAVLPLFLCRAPCQVPVVPLYAHDMVAVERTDYSAVVFVIDHLFGNSI